MTALQVAPLPEPAFAGSDLESLAQPSDWSALTGQTPADPDALLAELVAASAAVRRYCRWHISPVHEEEIVTIDARGGRVLMLPTMRLLTVHEIVETQRGKGQLPLTVDLDEIEATEKGWLYRDRPWSNRLSGVQVTMTHGYDPTEVLDLATAVATMVARSMANPTGIDQAMVGTVQIRYARQTDGVYMVIGGFDAYARQLS